VAGIDLKPAESMIHADFGDRNRLIDLKNGMLI
jgi:hypothetical protein